MKSVPVPGLNAPGRLEFPGNLHGYVFYLVGQIMLQRQQLIEPRLQALGLNIVSWRPLLVIGLAGECQMTKLARLTGIDRTTLTRAVDRLIASGLLLRKEHEKDRRLVLLSLTPKGRGVYEQGLVIHEELNSHMIGDMSVDAQTQLSQALIDLLDRATPNRDNLTEILDPGGTLLVDPAD